MSGVPNGPNVVGPEMAHPIQFKALSTFDNFKNLNLRFQIAIYD